MHLCESGHRELDLVGVAQTVEAVEIGEVADCLRHRGTQRAPPFRRDCGLGLVRALRSRQCLSFRIRGGSTVFACADQYESSPVLWNTKLRGIKCLRWRDLISLLGEISEQHIHELWGVVLGTREKARHSRYVLHYKIAWAKFTYQSCKRKNQLVPHVIELALSDHGKALTRRAADDNIQLAVPIGGTLVPFPSPLDRFANALRGYGSNVGAQDLGPREIESMHRAVDGVVLDRGEYIEPCLLESEREAASAGEEVDSYRPTHGGRYLAPVL